MREMICGAKYGIDIYGGHLLREYCKFDDFRDSSVCAQVTCNPTIGNWFNDWLGSSNLQILTKLYLARAIFQQPEPQRREKGTMIMMLSHGDKRKLDICRPCSSSFKVLLKNRSKVKRNAGWKIFQPFIFAVNVRKHTLEALRLASAEIASSSASTTLTI